MTQLDSATAPTAARGTCTAMNRNANPVGSRRLVSRHLKALAWCGALVLAAPSSVWSQAAMSGPAAQVAPCSWTPNCVSSAGKPGESKYIAPLRPQAGETEPLRRLKSVVSGMTGAKLVVEQPFLLKYEFTSARMKYVDDVQFSLVPATGLIEMRSASRVGLSDFGVNRERMERVRSLYEGGSAGRAAAGDTSTATVRGRVSVPSASGTQPGAGKPAIAQPVAPQSAVGSNP